MPHPKKHVAGHYALETDWRRRKPKIKNARPATPRGTAATAGTIAVLIPLAKSEGFGAVVELAMASNDNIIISTVAKKQHNASPSRRLPVVIIQRVGRVRDAAVVVVLGSYGF